MEDDKVRGAAVGTDAVAADEQRDERRVSRTSGDASRLGAVAGTGVTLLLVGGGITRAVLKEVVVAPWAGVALYAVAACVAVLGMVIAARMMGRREPDPPAVAMRGVSPRGQRPPHGGGSAAPLERFQVDTRAGRRIIAATLVEWLEAHGNYARLHLVGESFLYRMPLAQLEHELDAHRFLRVHRSAIVNLDAIARVETLPSGDAELWLASGARVRMSRRYAKAFHERTGRGH